MTLLMLVFFAFSLGIGLIYARRAHKPQDFYLAGQANATTATTASLLATILGSSAILGTVSLAQKTGWAAVWLLWSGGLGLLALIPLAERVRRQAQFTLPDLLEHFYGTGVKRLACAMIPLAWTGVVAAQIIGAGKIIAALTPLSYPWGAALTALVLALYTALGGQRSIIRTDLWQLLLMLVGLGSSAAAAIKAAGIPSWNQIHATFPFNPSFTSLDLAVLGMTYATTFLVGPDVYSRLFCARDEQTARRSVLVTVLLLVPVSAALVLIATTGHRHGFGFLSGPLLSPIIGIALLSAVISSADTTLLTAASISSEFFIDLKQPPSIRLTQRLILLIGAVSLMIALMVANIIQSLLLAFSFFSGAFTIPVLAGLCGFKTTASRAMTACAAGGLTALAGKILVLTSVPGGNAVILAGFLMNAVILFGPSSPRTNKKGA